MQYHNKKYNGTSVLMKNQYLVESKYFECEECREYSIRLIFAPEAKSATQLLAFTQMMKPDIEKESCEVWIIGAPENELDEDCGHITMQAWPTQTKPELIPASEFNTRIVHIEQNHCQQTNNIKSNAEEPQWQSIGMLNVFSEMIDGMLEVSVEQIESLTPALDKPHILDDDTLTRIIKLYKDELNDQWIFKEQFTRWKNEDITSTQKQEVERLLQQLPKLKLNGENILKLTGRIEHGTIDKIMAMNEIDLLDGILSGDIKPPR